MFRKPLYLIITLIIFLFIGFFEYRLLERQERNIEELERIVSEELREYISYRNYSQRVVFSPSRTFIFIDLRELNSLEKKSDFLSEYLKSVADQYGLQSEVKVTSGGQSEWLRVVSQVAGPVYVYQVDMEIQNYPGILPVLDFVKFLRNFPIEFKEISMGAFGEKKGFIKMKFNFIETYEE